MHKNRSIFWLRGHIRPAPSFGLLPRFRDFPIQLVQAVPTASGPDLYSIQTSSDGTQSVVQALTSDGRQLVANHIAVLNNNSVPDGGGGLLVEEYDTCTPGQTNPLTVVDLDPMYGQPASAN